jgi:hypothetical protein
MERLHLHLAGMLLPVVLIWLAVGVALVSSRASIKNANVSVNNPRSDCPGVADPSWQYT